MENKIPSRFEEIYCDKMKFDKYEYTNFIAYELARRNSNVMDLSNLSFELLSIYDSLLPTLKRYEGAIVSDDISKVAKEIEEEYKKTLLGLVDHYNKNQFEDEIDNLTFDNFTKTFSTIIYSLAEELYDKYYIIYQNDLETLDAAAKELYDPSKYLERDKLLTKHFNEIYNGEENHKADYNINYTQNKYFMVYQEIPKNQKDFSSYVIYPKFKNAMRDFTDTKVALNLNLSEDELVDYIKKIKKNYDSKNSIIKTKRELLEEKLDGSDEDIKINSAAKWADNFFIYDYYLYHQVNDINKADSYIKRDIQMELTKFHGVRVHKNLDEIKNTKDTKYKYVPLEKYKRMEGYIEDDDLFEALLDENQAMSIKSIADKYELIDKYIQGESPLYKTLLEK